MAKVINMTKLDLEDIEEIIVVMRNHPERLKNIQIVDELINALGDAGINTKAIKSLPVTNRNIGLPSNGNDHLLYESIKDTVKPIDNNSVIKDKKIYVLLRQLFVEARILIHRQEYEKLSELMDSVHNIPYLIMDNNLTLPYEIIKKRKLPNYIGHGKKFLKNYRKYVLKYYNK